MLRDILISLSQLPDAELSARLRILAAGQRDAMAQLVAHLAELDTRDVHLREGYGSLFTYCRDALALSEQEAYNRIQAARAARRFPVILEMLADASINLTTVRLLAPHLTSENYRRALESARGKTKIQVEEIVARLLPRPDVPPTIRKLPALTPATPLAAASAGGADSPNASPAVVPALPASVVPLPLRSGGATPLSPDRYKLQFTIGGETLEKLRLAKDMLRHAIPSGDEAALLDRALTALLAELARKKFAAADQPRPTQGTGPGSRHIPAEVRRTVWVRDLGRCAFVGTNGRRCDERGFLEFHHVQPYAAGGEPSVENIQLRCRRHNDYEARVYFGWDGASGRGGIVREADALYGVAERDKRDRDYDGLSSRRVSAAGGPQLVPERVRAIDAEPVADSGPGPLRSRTRVEESSTAPAHSSSTASPRAVRAGPGP